MIEAIWLGVDRAMTEFILSLALLILTAVIGVFLMEAQTTKPSLEKSQRIFQQSLIVFFFGLIISFGWFLLGINTEPNRTDFLGFSGSAILESILTVIFGLHHYRKHKEYTRVSIEIEKGLSGAESDQ